MISLLRLPQSPSGDVALAFRPTSRLLPTVARNVGVSGIMSGLQGTVSTGKEYSVVSVRGTDSTVCFGLLGTAGGKTAAFGVRENCNVKSHSETKFDFRGSETTWVFISRGVSTSMFTSPRTSEDVVPPAVRRSWVSKRMTLMGWVREIQAVENANNVLASEDEIK